MLSYQVILPAMGYKEGLIFRYLDDEHYGLASFSSAPGIPLFIAGYLQETLIQLWEGKELLFRVLGLPYFFLPLCGPLALLLSLPAFLLIVLQKTSMGIGNAHQLAPLLPGIIIAAVFGVRRGIVFLEAHRAGKWKGVLLTAVFLLVVISNFGYTRYGTVEEAGKIFDHRFVGVRNVFHPVFYRQDDQDRIAWKLISAIPEKASVCASGDLLPQLSHREHLFEVIKNDGGRLVKDQRARKDGSMCFSAECVLLRTTSIENGSSTTDFSNSRSEEVAQEFVRSGVFEYADREGDFILLRKRSGS